MSPTNIIKYTVILCLVLKLTTYVLHSIMIDWRELHTGSEIVIKISLVENPELHLDEETESLGLFKTNDGTYTFKGTYSHNVNNETVYVRDQQGHIRQLLSGSSFFFYFDWYDCTVDLLRYTRAYDSMPLNFVSIPAQYLEVVRQHRYDICLGEDHYDEGWNILAREEIDILGEFSVMADYVTLSDIRIRIWTTETDLASLQQWYAIASTSNSALP